MLNEILDEIRDEILKCDVLGVHPDLEEHKKVFNELAELSYRNLPQENRDNVRRELLFRAVLGVMCLEEMDQLS